MNSKLLLLFSVCLLISNISAAKYSKCYIAKLLLSYGVRRSQLENWVCLIESESSYKTDAFRRDDSDGSYVWGPFQIKDRYWCKGYSANSANACGVDCRKLISNNMYEAFKCAVKIYNIHGYSAWEGFMNRCSGKHFSLADCRDLNRYIRYN